MSGVTLRAIVLPYLYVSTRWRYPVQYTKAACAIGADAKIFARPCSVAFPAVVGKAAF